MADFDWKKLVGGIAPVLGTALLGPLGGEAAQILGKALGLSDTATPDDVGAALASGNLTTEQIVAVQAADLAYKQHLDDNKIELAKVNAAADAAVMADVQDARARQVATKDTMPQQILYILLFVYVLEVVLFYFGKMPQDEFVRALMTRAFATVELGLSSAIAYFIGSSRGSKQSGDAVRKIAMGDSTGPTSR